MQHKRRRKSRSFRSREAVEFWKISQSIMWQGEQCAHLVIFKAMFTFPSAPVWSLPLDDSPPLSGGKLAVRNDSLRFFALPDHQLTLRPCAGHVRAGIPPNLLRPPFYPCPRGIISKLRGECQARAQLISDIRGDTWLCPPPSALP